MKIKTQIFLLFLLLSVFLTSLFAVTIYHFTKALVLKQVDSHLESVSETKTAQLRNMIGNIHEMSSFLSKNQAIIKGVGKIQQDMQPNAGRELSIHLSQYVIDILKFRKIYILDTLGSVVASSDSNILHRNLSRTSAYLKGKESINQIIGFFYDADHTLFLKASDLIINQKNEWIGIVVIDLNADEFLELVNDYTGLGRSGETNMAMAQGEYALYMTPLKFDRNAALTRKVNLHDKEYAMSLALDQQTGFQENAIDYMGHHVIAYTRYLPETGWGIVTKIDKEEALVGVYTLQRILLMISLFFIGTIFIASFFLGGYIARPIEQLIELTNNVKEGNFKPKITISAKSELGTLANSFNEMTEKLEKKMDDLDKFAYIVSHDLKSPLNTITPLMELIQKDRETILSQESKRMMKMAEDKAIQMKELIDQVLLSATEDSLQKEVINTNRLLDQILENLNPPAHISVYVQKNLPPMRYHKVSLLQIFQNLIGNAIKYMDKSQGEIKVSLIKQNSHYLFSIQDNGRGIERHLLERIFGIFEKGHNEVIESSGIGLSIVKRIIEENKGRIWVESEVGIGSTFYFTIPLS
ncbi:sensor histidine kinase [Rhodocytophaga rosea]|uniref:histidine kinase n=1 Tax=Rhodocytophaga rosea TaxID=2704465 RepID=A0A6C0GL05_9BACT|nr:sensor histidine kinase [Rhodocytophaga rosea]QHT68761.1 sensor histidine kinase [Rhodocytophaga rosea]